MVDAPKKEDNCHARGVTIVRMTEIQGNRDKCEQVNRDIRRLSACCLLPLYLSSF